MSKKTQQENGSAEHIEPHLLAKRQELIWALAKQGYTAAQIGRFFRLDRALTFRIIKSMPKNYQTKWVKRALLDAPEDN